MYKEFDTARLLIRPTLEQDVDFIYQLMNTPKFIKYIGDRGINSPEDAEKYIQTKMIPQLRDLGFSSYTLITKTDRVKIGTCGLYNRDGVDGIDIGFALIPQYERLGFAYESSLRILKAAFEDFNLEEIKAITSKDNIASQHLLSKLGLELIGTTLLPKDDDEILLYKIEKEKWRCSHESHRFS